MFDILFKYVLRVVVVVVEYIGESSIFAIAMLGRLEYVVVVKK